jgi:hypothetical protein
MRVSLNDLIKRKKEKVTKKERSVEQQNLGVWGHKI